MSKALFLIIFVSILIFVPVPGFSQQQTLTVRLNQQVFVPGDTLVIYGNTLPEDALVVRIVDPSGSAFRTDVITPNNDGTFAQQLMQWDEPSKNLVFGRYTIEINSRFAVTSTIIVEFIDRLRGVEDVPLQSTLILKLDSPTDVSIGKSFRIFVQVTFQGALVNADPSEFLSSSHIHTGNQTINLAGHFNKLHEGIYYADVILEDEGTNIIHAIAFYRGFLAHDSKVVISGTSIGDIQQQVTALRQELDRTSQELRDTRQAVEDAREAIKQDIDTAAEAVDELERASGQINSIIIPILALIAIVIALQISLFARIRASYK